MKFIDKLKKNKRTKWIIFAVLALFIYSSFLAPTKKEAGPTLEECKGYGSTSKGYILTTQSLNTCTANSCFVEYKYSPSGWDFTGISTFGKWLLSKVNIQTDFAKCTNAVGTGKYVKASSTGNAAKQCASGASSGVIKKILFGDDFYQCKDSDAACNALERSIANVVWSIPGLDAISSCKSAYYIAIFGGGMMALMAFGMLI